MTKSNAARTLISFCMNLSSMVLVAMLLMQLVCCVRCTFVFVFPSCHRFFLGCWRRPGFLEDEELVRQAGEKHLQHAPFGWCSERRLRSWSEDGARDVQTRDAKRGEHGESSMVRPL